MSTATKTKSHSRRTAGVLLLVGVLAGVTIGGGAGVIAASSTKTVTVCVDKKDKHMNYSKRGVCKSHQFKVVLNKTATAGVKGDTGTAGAKGDTGAAGSNGAAGAKGDTGTAGISGANTNSQIKNICGDNGTTACAIGLKGPGGGVVFITPSTLGNTSGLFYEAAPNTWYSPSGDPLSVWCNDTTTTLGVSSSTFGSGAMDGAAKTATMLNVCTSGAANLADAYTATVNGVVYGDWFLPSKGELGQMYGYRTAIGGLTNQVFWSSSEFPGAYESSIEAWIQSMNGALATTAGKVFENKVRPVRAF
jgi:hypothetical protein